MSSSSMGQGKIIGGDNIRTQGHSTIAIDSVIVGCINVLKCPNYQSFIFYSCFSRVGRIGGEQTITVGPTCDKRGVVMHEMLHTLGRWHEHNRPDRDTYVTINRNNIKPGKETKSDTVHQQVLARDGRLYCYTVITL